MNLGQAPMFSGEYEQAEEVLRAVVAADPRSAGAYFLLGRCAEHLQNFDRALTHYRMASRLAPDKLDFFVSSMSLLSREDLRPQALEEIESGLSGPLRHIALWYKAKFEIAADD